MASKTKRQLEAELATLMEIANAVVNAYERAETEIKARTHAEFAHAAAYGTLAAHVPEMGRALGREVAPLFFHTKAA